MIDDEYLRDPRPFDGHRVLVHRGITQPPQDPASATAGSGEGDGKGEAIRAASKALQTFTARISSRNGVAVVSFGPADIAVAAYDAVEPIIRRQVAEEIARRIETIETNDPMTYDGVRDAAEIAREVGQA